MAKQDFETIAGLLPEIEAIVLEAHRERYLDEGKEWSRPIAYHWLRYEDPRPVDRLREGVEKLVRSGARFDEEAVEKACEEAEKRGFSI
jgi:hypothetical protein